MNKGDMVLLLACHPHSTGYATGVRERMIGTIDSVSELEGYDWVVQFPGIPWGCSCPEKDLRKIDPPAAGDWKYCVYKPGKSSTSPTPKETEWERA